MFRCKECGENIDEYQFNNFNGLCPNCKRLSQSQQSSSKPLTGKVVQLTAAIQSRKQYHWVIWVFVWFSALGFIALFLVFFLHVVPLPVLFIGLGFLLAGIVGIIVMRKYIAKTKEIEQQLNQIT